jgi:hypothetical protein
MIVGSAATSPCAAMILNRRALLLAFATAGCSPSTSSIMCGPGTTLAGDSCIPEGGEPGGTDASTDALPEAHVGDSAEGGDDAATDAKANSDGSSCGADGACNPVCPAGVDPDCGPCGSNAVCDPACASGPACTGTPACVGPPPVSGAACGTVAAPANVCSPGMGACAGWCECVGTGDFDAGAAATWICFDAAGSTCGGQCPAAAPLHGDSCTTPLERCSWKSADGLCWTNCVCTSNNHGWSCDVGCDCPGTEPVAGSACDPHPLNTGLPGCYYGTAPHGPPAASDAANGCRSYQCVLAPSQGSAVWTDVTSVLPCP